MLAYKFQIASMAVLLILGINYFRNKRLPLMSTKIFSFYMVVAIINVLFDTLTVYTIGHYQTISHVFNRFAHQVFIGSLDVLIFSLYLYVVILTNDQKRPGVKEIILRVTPFTIAMLMVVFGPLYYRIEPQGRYSYGPMASMVYLSIAIYIILIGIRIKRYFKYIATEKAALIICGLSLWAVAAIIQLLNPTVLMSSVGVMVMVLLIYLSFENPMEYADVEVGTLNRTAFHRMVPEMIESGKKFYLVNFVLDDVKYIQDAFGYAEVRKILSIMGEYIDDITCLRIYHSRSNVLSVMVINERKLEKLLSIGDMWVSKYENVSGVNFVPKFHIDVLECPKYASDTDRLFDIMDYLVTNVRHEGVMVVDDDIISENDRYEKIQEIVEHAVYNDGFEVFYQPIYSNESKSFASAEALIRLKDKETIGFISPEIFIPIAEKKGLINEIGNIVFEKVCAFAKEQQVRELGVHYIEVNLSGMQGVDVNLVPTLRGYMEKYEIDPEFINLEITETASVEAGDILLKNMQTLREMGCHFSMDDFGTGYSNLSQMVKVKFELIKLDKSLIWPCFEEHSEEPKVILDNCVKMIRQLGIKIVAEGVETEEQADLLTNMGVTYLQGYYFSRPIPESEYLEFLKKQQAK